MNKLPLRRTCLHIVSQNAHKWDPVGARRIPSAPVVSRVHPVGSRRCLHPSYPVWIPSGSRSDHVATLVFGRSPARGFANHCNRIPLDPVRIPWLLWCLADAPCEFSQSTKIGSRWIPFGSRGYFGVWSRPCASFRKSLRSDPARIPWLLLCLAEAPCEVSQMTKIGSRWIPFGSRGYFSVWPRPRASLRKSLKSDPVGSRSDPVATLVFGRGPVRVFANY